MTRVDGSGALENVLGGRQGARGVRELVLHPLEHGGDEILDQLRCSSAPFSLELLRSKYKPSRKLTATYRTRGKEVSRSLLLTVCWTLGPTGVETTVLVAPADPAMPQVARLNDAHHVASLLESLTGRPAPLREKGQVRIVRYRPGQRHVLAVPFRSGDVYVKTDRDGRGALAVERAVMLGEVLAVSDPLARIVEPIGWIADDSAALWRESPGRTLSELIRSRDPARGIAVARIGRALRALHDATARALPLPAPEGSPLDPGAEAVAIGSAGAHITALLPCGSLYTTLIEQAVEALGRLPADSAVIAHGDFKGDNLLIDRDRASILDVDRTCVAEPSIDLGKFLADLAWWCVDAGESSALGAAFRGGYGPSDPARWARADLWAVLFDLKIAARRCALHDADWATHVRRRVEAAATRLSDARHPSGQAG